VSSDKVEVIRYRRARFSNRLPVQYRYTAAHYWLAEAEPGLWRVGFTRFATRMLGDVVEFGFTPPPGARIDVGDPIGWLEGFKAITDLYSAGRGEFAGPNPRLEEDITLLDGDSYGEGWLYQVRGEPDPNCVDVHGYLAILDTTIDKMLEQSGGEYGSE
jgi:glycine cleavage system H protein